MLLVAYVFMTSRSWTLVLLAIPGVLCVWERHHVIRTIGAGLLVNKRSDGAASVSNDKGKHAFRDIQNSASLLARYPIAIDGVLALF